MCEENQKLELDKNDRPLTFLKKRSTFKGHIEED